MFKSVFKPKNMVRFFAVFLVVFILVTTLPNARAEYIVPQTVTQDDKTYYSFTDESVFYRKGTAGSGGNGRLNARLEYSDNRFMLTEDNQEFVFEQRLWMRQAHNLDDHNIHFQRLTLYYDGTVYDNEVASDDPDTDGEILVENRPDSGEVHTEDMVNNHDLTVTWSPDNADAENMWDTSTNGEGQLPKYDFPAGILQSNYEDYYYKATVSFKTNEALDTNFYYDVYWIRGDERHTLIGVNIKITDVRALISDVQQIQNDISEGKYNAEQIEIYENRIDNIPEGMLDGTKYYTQSAVDTARRYLNGEFSNLADSDEYLYYRDKVLDLIKKDSSGNYIATGYTTESLATLETNFKNFDIYNDLPYEDSRQNEVDAATANLRNWISSLVSVNFAGETETTPDTKNSHLSLTLNNNTYKYVQTRDDEPYSIYQDITAQGKDYDAGIYSTTAAEFISFVSDSDFINSCIVGWENDPDKNILNQDAGNYEIFNITNGTLDETTMGADVGFLKINTIYKYRAHTTINFNDNPAGVYGGIDASFNWKLTSSYDGTPYESLIPVTILITDVRPLIELYDELYGLAYFSSMADERAKYSTTVINNLKTALAKSTGEYSGMINGASYYDQATVNAYYNELNNVLPKPADYTALDEAISRYEALTHNNYTEASIQTAKTAYAKAKAVERTLDTTNQSIIDSAAANLNNALDSLVLKPADYTELNNAILSYEAKNSADYTQDSWQTATTAYNEAKAIDNNLDITHQSEIDAAADNLSNAITNLVQNKANYTALDEAINLAKGKLNSGIIYTTSTTNALKSALTNAENVSRDLLATEQNTVNQLTTALNNAITGLLEKADYSVYNTALQSAKEKLNDQNYTDESKMILSGAITDAEKLNLDLADTEENRKTISDATTALNDAMTGLDIKPADYTGYEKVWTEVKSIIDTENESKKYTASSFETFKTEANKINDGLAKDLKIDEQSVVDTAKTNLETAKLGLEIRAEKYTDLETVITEAENKLNNANNHTQESKDELSAVISSAKNLVAQDLKDTTENNATIEAKIQEIANAIAKLDENEYANYEALNNAIAAANEKLNDGKTYTTATITVLNTTLEKANELANGEKLLVGSQETITKAAEDLENATTNLKEKADYSAYNIALQSAKEKLNDQNYTDESKMILSGAITDAEKLNLDLADTEENRKTIADATTALNNAIDNLVLKDADYSEYTNKYNELNSITNDGTYTNSGFNAFKEEIQKIDTDLSDNLTILEQSKIDEAVAKLDAVKKTLEANKRANYENYNAKFNELNTLVNNDNYSETAFTEFKSKVQEINNGLDKDLVDTEENRKIISNAITALEEAKNELEANRYADCTELKAKITETQTALANATNCTEKSKIALSDAITSAQNVVNEKLLANDENNARIEEEIRKLNTAIAGLEEKANYTALNSKIAEAKAEVAKTDLYTADSISNLQKVIDEAEALSDDLSVEEQEQITVQITKLTSAVNGLEKQDANYTAYNELLSELQSIISANNTDKKYVATAFETFKTTVTNIDNSLAKDLKIDEQKKIDDAKVELESAKTTLEENKRADYSAYDSKYQELTSFITDENKAKYDPTAWEEYTEAVKNINDGLNKDLVDNAENIATISNAITALESAKTTLETKKYADYSALNQKITEAQTKLDNATNCTEKSRTALSDAITSAQKLVNEKLFESDENNTRIANEVVALETAINGLKVKADYTGYNTKFNELNSFTNDGSYSESAFNTFKTEIARIDSSLNKDLADTEANRKTIEDAITALNNAKKSLENNSYADYTRLNNALTKAEAVLNDGKTYTDVTKISFDTALKNAKAVEPGLLSDKQDYIDSVADKLEKATNGLKVKADYTAYNTALQNAKTEVAKTDLYTADSISNLQKVIDEAEALSDDLSVEEQEQITVQITKLTSAVNGLEKQDANYTAYNELLSELQSIISANNTDKKYVATAFETFKTTVTNIDNSLAKDLKIDEQKKIDDAKVELESAKTTLEENKRADYSAYDSKYQELTSFITDENKAKYDPTAWKEYTETVKSINDGLNKDLVDNAENIATISNAITALESAKTTLETKKYANYNELNNAIANAESILNDGKTYTQKSKTALEDALTIAKSIEEKLFVGDQNKIDSAKEKLVSAINEVKVKADYSELNKAILDAKEQLKNENYTDESRGILSGVIGDAEKLDKDLSVEETEKITEKINAIKNAVKELKLKSADYSKLDKAILEAKAIDSKIYTNASLEVLEVVLQNAESINRNLFITEQNTVDQLTDALNNAVSGLKVRADYVKYNDTYSSMLAITNENGIYSENAFNTFKTEIARIDSSLNKDLADTEANRKTIEDAITALNNAKTSLENNSYADYTRLNNALTKAEAVLNDGKTYTDVTKSAFNTALKNAKAVEPGLLSDKQDYIDSVAEKLEKATNGLKVKADYTAYNTALQNAKTEVVKTDLYTVDTISDLEKVIEDAEKLNQDLSVDEQNQITEQVTKLNNAVGALKKQAADYSKLNRAIKTAESKEKSNYTDASWSIMKSAYDTAKALPKDLTIDRQSEVDVVEKTLTDTINGLKFKSAVYTALDKAIASYEALTITDYTESTIKIATDAYNKAKEVDRSLTVNDQAIVDDLTVALNNAIGALELKKADYSALDKAITDAKTKTNDGKLYTKTTLNALKTALKSAELVDRDLFITEQGTIDNATSSLVTAIKSLKEKVDYSELHKVINTAEATLKNSTDYTEESKKVLSDAIEAAKNINDDLPDTEENRKMIAAEVEKLKNSMDNLRLKPADYSELDKAITDAESKLNNGTVYTDNTIEVLNTTLKKANKIDRSLFIRDQKIVDETTKSLVEAITSLKEKADYSDYNRIFAEAQAIILNGNNSQYDEIIWNDFVDIVGAVDEALNKDLSVADQAIVDEATTALNEAMKKLYDQLKADYSKLDSAIRSAKDVLNDGKVYTSKSETNLKNALKNAEAVDRGLFVDNQSIIDEATDILNKAIADIVERADYTEIEEEVIESEEILSEEKPEDDIIYTTSSKNALQEALLAFENLDEDLPVDKQYIVTEIETDIEAARIGIKIKADYTKLDKAVAEAEELLSLDVEYVDLYRIMLENTLVLAENVHRDLSTDDQSTIDNVTGYINYAMDKLNRRADYSEYDAALSEIKDIVRKGYDGSCDYKDWDEFVATVTDVAVNLPQNLPVEEQAQVDKALEKITDAREIYESKKYIVNEEQQGEVVLPTDPENPESVSEPTELVINSQSTARKEDGLLIGLPQGTTVAELLTQFNNDSAFLLVKDMNGECITAESLIATGMTIELVSKDDIQVILEKVTVVVKGDVTGDGLVNREDYKKSFNVCFGNDTYSDSERAFFEASDTNGNGRIDINDMFNISNLRLFVSRLYALCISD